MSVKGSRRVPQCARCRIHNTPSSVRGHKRVCKYRDCTCVKCQMVTEKRRVTAVRVAVLRRERKRRNSRMMNVENFQLGATPGGAWGMMGNMPAGFTSEQFIDNRMLVHNNMLHIPYTTMYPFDNEYQPYPGQRLSHRDAPENNEASKTKDSDISRNMANFEHEYESLMRQPSEHGEENDDVLPGNKTDKLVPSFPITNSYANGPARIFVPPTTTPFYVNGPTITPGSPHRPPMSPTSRRFFPMILNAPLPLPCSYPISPGHSRPYRVEY